VQDYGGAELASEVSTSGGETGFRYEIDFRAGGTGQETLIAGWSYPERDYTWTLGPRSILHIPVATATCDSALKFRAGPMVRQGVVSFQRLHVAVNGRTVARLVSRAPSVYELYVPADVLKERPVLEIEFQMPDAHAPDEVGGPGDTRELGVWLSSLQLAPLARPTGGQADNQAATDKALLMDLQSLGENCELGFVQRLGGAEPLGLFRWASTPLQNLLAALDARFAGLGAIENLAIEVDEASEFQVLDRRFGFRNHSFAFQNAGAKRDDILKREVARLPFMARIMIEDLEGGQKLFCFHDAGRSNLDRIELLTRALGKYGPNWLLWVYPAGAPARVGTAERIGDRLIRGYVDKFQPLHNVKTPSVAAWMGAIRVAHGLWRTGRSKG
jgi:hypothetical protein